METLKYPIGEQDFKSLREAGCVYVDKTQFIERIVSSGSKYYFLARPRRFGKSLFISTLKYFFEGRRELFEGLKIASSEWDWNRYPVLHLDLNTDRYAEDGKLDDVLGTLFRDWEEKYDIMPLTTSLSQRFKRIIEAAYLKTGRQVVILVDEYDKPLVGNLNNSDLYESYRNQLSSIYSNFKSSAEYIRLVYLSGVSRFSKLSIFSDLNNLKDITFEDSYADLCGITFDELRDYFGPGVKNLAEKEELSEEKTYELLKANYDGYKFSAEGSEIYNPWAVLNCLENQSIQSYWSDTGMPTLVAEALKKVNADLEKVFDMYCSLSELKGFDLQNPQPAALLYQTGYLTIKEYNRKVRRYRLGIPNAEVKESLLTMLLPYYVRVKRGTPNQVLNDLIVNFTLGNPDEAMEALQAYFAGIDFKMKMDNENNFHNAFYLLTDLLGLETKTEVHTSEGSIDMTIETEDYLYIIELKYDHSSEEALRQIEEKHYARRYRTDSRSLILIGANFSSKSRCIEDWKIKRL